MKYCVCKQCGEKVNLDSENLWGHLRLDHADLFYNMSIYHDSDMVNECYKIVNDERILYRYSGPVTNFGRIIDNNFIATTLAESEKKALNNISWRFKCDNGIESWVKIELPGKLIAIN